MEVVGIEEIAEVIFCTKNRRLKTKFNNFMIKTLKVGIKGTHLNIIKYIYDKPTGLPQWLSGKESTCNAGDTGDSSLIPGWEDPLEEGMTTYSSISAGRIPMGRGDWRATIRRVAKCRT